MKSTLISALASTVSTAIGAVAPFIVLWYGLSSIMEGHLTLGTFFAINSFLGYLYGPARNLTQAGYSISRAMAGLERIYELFTEKQEPREGEPIDSVESIEFRDVGFSYNAGANNRVLDGLNLKINRGERIALVGESGEGKSTLVKMILKFYAPTSGALYISGKNSKNISVTSLRKKTAYISQRQYIFEDDLEEKKDDPAVKKLLNKFKFEKSLEEPGADLQQKEFSGGEVQKLEIIETLLKEADVLIIDEGTSNIDFKGEKILLAELFEKYRDKIIIFIAHRLTTIIDFERIAVLNSGRIVEEGTHAELMKNKGCYFSLWGNRENKP